jgi:hypothetical protein
VYPQLSELDQHRQEYENWFSAVDDELYRLFRAHSGHGDPRSVYVKVTFLNRVYMTGVERAASSPDPCEQIATLLVSRGTEVEARIDALRAISILSPKNLAQVAQVHGWLAQEVLGKAGVGQPVSFVSKYLHFHAPVVPIYDSHACTALGQYIRARFGKQFVASESRRVGYPSCLSSCRTTAGYARDSFPCGRTYRSLAQARASSNWTIICGGWAAGAEAVCNKCIEQRLPRRRSSCRSR